MMSDLISLREVESNEYKNVGSFGLGYLYRKNDIILYLNRSKEYKGLYEVNLTYKASNSNLIREKGDLLYEGLQLSLFK